MALFVSGLAADRYTITARPALRHSQRRGVAAVEFALVSPLLFLVAFGSIEFGRAMMVGAMLNNTVRAGCRAGTMNGVTNTNVNDVIAKSLAGISGTTTSIQVNGTTADVSTAAAGDTISVKISVPYGSVSWLPTNTYLGAVILSAQAVMPHE